MAGLYIHIPFCSRRCAYCDFFSTTRGGEADIYVDAAIREMEMERSFTEQGPLETIYMGGGTPSQLTTGQLRKLYDGTGQVFGLSGLVESTIECNPDDLTPEYLAGLKDLPINRISMGIQSFDDSLLRLINRRHDAAQAIQAVENCHSSGFGNISIDLMYGLPGQSVESFRNDIETALSLPVTHISAYCLSYERGTRLTQMRDSGSIIPVGDEECESMYHILCEMMSEAGFCHYEISNFCKPGFESRHNSSYWNGTPYLGIGAGAHSYFNNTRHWNVSDLDRFCKGITGGKPDREYEFLDSTTRRNEMVMLSLRTSKGLDTKEFARLYGKEGATELLRSAQPYILNGMLIYSGDTLSLSRRGIFISDSIISSLFV